jgi:outer membrane lipoprotein-sorting protein
MSKLRGACVAAVIGAIMFAPVSGQSLDEILAQHYDAIGGRDAWLALQSTRSTGALTLMGGAATGGIEVTAKRPAMIRAVVTIQGIDVIQSFDGETAWGVNPLAGVTAPQVADPVTTGAMAEQADLDGPLVGWEGDGHQIDFVGTETVGEKEAYRLNVTFPSGESSSYFLDTTSYMLIRVEATRNGIGTTTADLFDYREVAGLMFPFSVNSVSPQGDQSVIWETIETNVEVDDSLFRMPDS